MSETVNVRVIRTLEEIDDVRHIWSRFQKHHLADVNFYLEYESSTPGFVRPYILVLYRNAQPDAMLIGKVHDTVGEDLAIGSWYGPRARVLRIQPRGLLGNQCPANCTALLRQILTSLREQEADMAMFWDLKVGTPAYTLATSLPGWLNRDPFPGVSLHCSVILPERVEEVLRGLSAKARKNLKWQAKQLLNTSAGNVRVVCFRLLEEVEQMIQDVEQIAKRTWQRGLGKGFIPDQDMRQRLYLAARQRWLQTYVLYVADKPCAFCVGTLYDNTYYTDFIGYDQDYARYSPGMFLLTQIFDDLCKSSVKQLDFYRGSEAYKQRFGNCNWHQAAVCIFAPTFRGLRLKVLRVATGGPTSLAKRFLEGTELLTKLRKARRKDKGRARLD